MAEYVVWGLFALLSLALGIRLNQLKEPEPQFLAKFLFFCVLGVVSFPVGGFNVPIGFLLSFLFFPKQNSRYKWYGALLGFVCSLVLLFIPATENTQFRAETQQMGVIEMKDESLQRFYDQMAKRLPVEKLKLDRGKITVTPSGQIESMEYLFLMPSQTNETIRQIQVTYTSKDEQMEYVQVDELPLENGRTFYDKLIAYDKLFDTLVRLKWKDVDALGDAAAWQLNVDGIYDMYTYENEGLKMINRDGRIVPLWPQRDPILSHSIHVYGLSEELLPMTERTTVLYNYSILPRKDLGE